MRFTIIIYPVQQATAIGSERSTERMWMWRIGWRNHYVLAFSCYPGRLVPCETRRLSILTNKVICSMMDFMYTSTYIKDFFHNIVTYLIPLKLAFLHNRKIPACINFSIYFFSLSHSSSGSILNLYHPVHQLIDFFYPEFLITQWKSSAASLT